MLKRFVFILTALLMIVSAAAVMAQDDDFQPVTFFQIEPNVLVQDALFDTTTARLYAFNAAEGDTVTIEMAPTDGSTIDPFLVLLGAAGQVIASNDDFRNNSPTAVIEADIPATGSYLILATTLDYVDGAGGQAVGDGETLDYTIAMQGNTVPENNDEIIYYRFELEYNAPSFGGYSSAEEPVYYFVFSGQAGDVVTITTSSIDIDTLLMLYDPVGDRLAVNDDSTSVELVNRTDSAISAFELPVSGEYLVFVTDVAFYEADDSYEGGDFFIELRTP